MKPDKGAFIRAVIYSLALLYLFVDLFVVEGPFYRKVRGADPSSKAAIAAETAKGVAARVFYQPILLTQIDRRVQEKLWREGASPEGLAGEALKTRRLAALDEIFEEHLLRLKARFNYEDLSVTDDEVAAAVRKFKQKFASEALLSGAILNQGWQGEEELVARVQAKLEQENYLEKYIEVGITEDELSSYYQTYRERFTLPERVRARHIFFASLDHPDGEAKRLAQDALESLRRGKSFAELAREVSEDSHSSARGGDLGWMSADRLPHDFAGQIFDEELLTPTLVQTLLGAHVVEKLEYKPARERSFDEVQAELKAALSNQRREEGLKQYIRQLRYRDRYKTEVFAEVLARPWSLPDA